MILNSYYCDATWIPIQIMHLKVDISEFDSTFTKENQHTVNPRIRDYTTATKTSEPWFQPWHRTMECTYSSNIRTYL